jgi:hypothetical protein
VVLVILYKPFNSEHFFLERKSSEMWGLLGETRNSSWTLPCGVARSGGGVGCAALETEVGDGGLKKKASCPGPGS